eukprot:COSAG01_NODE_259_length_20069_cov_21.507762_4_plen_91_part_00
MMTTTRGRYLSSARQALIDAATAMNLFFCAASTSTCTRYGGSDEQQLSRPPNALGIVLGTEHRRHESQCVSSLGYLRTKLGVACDLAPQL